MSETKRPAVGEMIGRLGDRPEQLTTFRDYLAAFSAGDLDRFPRYYTDDIQFDLTVAPVLDGKAEVIAFYREMFSVIKERVTLEQVAATPDGIFADIDVLFTAIKDAPDFPLRPMKAGTTLSARFQVVYTLRDGLISALKVTPRE